MTKTYEKKTDKVLEITEMKPVVQRIDVDILKVNIANTEAQLTKMKAELVEVENELKK